MLNGFTRLGYGLKYSNPISEFFLIIGTNAIFSVGKFHFTEINHIITPIDKKVDLGTAPLISILHDQEWTLLNTPLMLKASFICCI